MDAIQFYPRFNDGVFVNNPNGTRTHISRENCLMPDSAMELVVLLAHNGVQAQITPGPANKSWDGLIGVGFSFTEMVPWLVFTKADGSPHYEMAGQLGGYWLRATNNDVEPPTIDYKTALKNCLTDIRNVIEGN